MLQIKFQNSCSNMPGKKYYISNYYMNTIISNFDILFADGIQ